MNEDYQSAITSSEYAIAIDPNDPDSVLSKANSLYNLENYESALTYYQRYSQILEDDEFGYLHQGTCLVNLGRFEEAAKVLQQAEKLANGDSPYMTEIYQELSFTFSELHDPDRAVSYIDKTKDLDCDHVNMEIIRGHILLANKRSQEAEEAFKNALKLCNNAPHAILRIIVSLYDNHYVYPAYLLLKPFLKHAKADWKDGYSYMALCCMDLHKKKEFLQYVKLGSEKNPKEARLVLGFLFPEGMKPSEYYDYLVEKFKQR
jgi:tetratricopeptide (TPR) repeat protein